MLCKVRLKSHCKVEIDLTPAYLCSKIPGE